MKNYERFIFQDLPDLLDIHQLQEALHIGRSRAYQLIHSGKLVYIRVGKTIRIPKMELLKYLQNNANLCYNEHCCSQEEQAVRKEFSYNDSKFES